MVRFFQNLVNLFWKQQKRGIKNIFDLKFLPELKNCKRIYLKSNGYDDEFHCVKSVQIRSFFWSVFSRSLTEYGEIRRFTPYFVRMRENVDQKKLHIWTLFTQCSLLRWHYPKSTSIFKINEKYLLKHIGYLFNYT